MKKGKPVVVGWSNLMESLPVEPEGYSTAAQISKKCNISITHVRVKLNALVDAGKLKAIKGKTGSGQTSLFFKD